MVNFLIILSKLIYFLKLKRKYRRLIFLFIDTFIIYFSYNFSLLLVNEKIISQPYYFLSIILIGLLIYSWTGQYKGLSRHIESKALYAILCRNLILTVTIYLVLFLNKDLLSYKFLISFLFISTISSSFIRFLLRDLLRFIIRNKEKSKNIVVYGAGEAGAEIISALKLSISAKILYLVDDKKELHGRSLNGITIKSPENIFIDKEKIDQILIAIPSLSKLEKFEIIKKFENCDIQIIQIPSIKSITERQQNILNSNELSIDDLLGRKSVDPDWNLIKPEINNSVICITGAGGSIGSEICREIIKLNPKLLIMVDNHEYSLYKIEKEFSNKNNLRFILGNICDEELIKNVFKDLKVQIVFHCAAYKHVPLLESNKIICLKNNINSTKVICKQAFENNIQKLILISSDKAVRPTNIMGASKRLAELIVQAYSTKSKELSNSDHTIFSMVRFGNVLGSSGSVVPLFQKQISQGGPITLTDKKVIRFFMTINEASHLVLHASAMAKGGEVFLLDMGEPVNIYSLAKQMITINGLKIKDKNNPNGDIEIQTIGLRKGEKLYEELLIDAESETTEHQLIYRANESSIKPEILFKKLNELDISLNEFNIKKSIDLLNELVKDWNIKN
mgnify:CR=1 FL=1